jgi:hypothetical protein
MFAPESVSAINLKVINRTLLQLDFVDKNLWSYSAAPLIDIGTACASNVQSVAAKSINLVDNVLSLKYHINHIIKDKLNRIFL